jgi:Rubredoxin-like zinc ribbon domain (DUF35_N)
MELETKSSASQEDRVLPASMANRDFDFFYEGLALGEFRIQKCGDCGTVRSPPGPMRPHSRYLKWTALKCSGTGCARRIEPTTTESTVSESTRCRIGAQTSWTAVKNQARSNFSTSCLAC